MTSILHVTNLYEPYVGGTEIYVKKIAEGLERSGYDSTVLTTDALFPGLGHPLRNPTQNRERHPVKRETVNGVDVERVPYCLSSNGLWERIEQAVAFAIRTGSFPVSPLLSGLFRDPAGIKLLAKGLSEDPDVIHASSATDSCLAAAILLGSYHDVPVVVRPAWHFDEFSMDYWRPIFEQATAVVAATEFEREYYLSNGLEAEQVHTIGYGVDYEAIATAPEEADDSDDAPFSVFVMSSRLNEKKGVPQCVEAANHLPDVAFEIAGPKADLADRDLHPNCELVGLFSGAEKYEALHEADVFVLPSTVESFGIVYFEAMSAGAPVVTADIPICRELYSDVGIQVDSDSPEAISDAVRELKTDDDRRSRLSAKAEAKAKDHEWEQIIGETEALFEHVLSHPR